MMVAKAMEEPMAVHVVKRVFSIHYAWIVVAATFLALLTAAGVRSTFGVYLQPLETEFLTNRSEVALIASLSILINGASQPIIGHILDRYGVRRVAIISLGIGAVGLFVSSLVTGIWQLYITFGVVVSAAVGGPATTMSTVVATRWFHKHRGLVIGLMSAGNSAGQVILIPVAMGLVLAYGWRMSYVLFGIGMLVLLIPIGLLIRSDPRDMGKQPLGAGQLSGSAEAARVQEDTRRTPLRRALRMHSFWMLATGFFVCGYSGTGTVATHLVAYTADKGIDSMAAATALGIIGGVSLFGTIFVGFLTDRVGRKNPLATVYFIRGTALLFLLFVDDPVKLNIFALIFGLGHFATVPPTAALTGQIFGRLSVGVIYGVIFSIHQIGGALGAFVGGWLYDFAGTYFVGIIIATILCYVAAAASFSIKEERVRKPKPAVALG